MKNKGIYLIVLLIFQSGFIGAQNKTGNKKGLKQPLPAKAGMAMKSGEKRSFVDIITDSGTMRVMLYNETPKHRDNFLKLAGEGFYDSLLFHRVIREFMIQGGDPQSKYASDGQQLGAGDVGYRIPAEFNKNLYHKKGALAAARDNNPEKASSGCQFYIVQGKRYPIKEFSNVVNGINYNNKMGLVNEYMARDSIKAKFADFNLRGDNEGLKKYMLSLQPIIDKQFEQMELRPTPKQINDYVSIGGAPHLDMGYTVFGEVVSGWEVIDKIAAVPTDAANRPLTNIRMKMKIVKQ